MSVPPEGPFADNVVPIHHYVDRQVQQVRDDFQRAIDHEKRNRQQFTREASEAHAALGPQGWVRLTLNAITDDVADLKTAKEQTASKDDVAEIKKGLGRVYLMAFGVLISTLSLLLTVVFQLATRGH